MRNFQKNFERDAAKLLEIYFVVNHLDRDDLISISIPHLQHLAKRVSLVSDDLNGTSLSGQSFSRYEESGIFQHPSCPVAEG